MRLAIQTVSLNPNEAGLGDHIVDPITYEPVVHLNFRHSTDRKLQLRFLEGATGVSASSIEVACKARGNYSGSNLMYAGGFTLVGSLSTGYYEAYPSFNGSAFNGLFNTGALKYLDTDFEIRWLNGSHVGVSMPVTARVWNNIIKDDDTEETPGVPVMNYNSGVINGPGIGVTSVLSDDAADLDSLVTVGINNRLIMIPETNAEVGYSMWYLQSGTGSDLPTSGRVRPLDYAASTNEKIWTGIL